MKKKRLLFILITIFIAFLQTFLSCKMKENKMCIEKKQIISDGEWYGIKDNLNGLSVRGKKIAFFKNMTFNSDDIYEYKFIDSIYRSKSSDRVINYLMVYDFRDTIYYKIKEFIVDDKISLIDPKGNMRSFYKK